MKILDEKGKVLGLLNIFDLLAILFIGFVILAVTLRIFFPQTLRRLIIDEPQKGYVTVEMLCVDLTTADKITIGDTQKTMKDIPYIRIVDFGIKKYSEFVKTTIVKELSTNDILWVKLEVYADFWWPDKKIPQFGNYYLKPGGRFVFNATNYVLYGTICSVALPESLPARIK